MILKRWNPAPPPQNMNLKPITSSVKLYSPVKDTNQVHDPLIIWNHLCVRAQSRDVFSDCEGGEQRWSELSGESNGSMVSGGKIIRK